MIVLRRIIALLCAVTLLAGVSGPAGAIMRVEPLPPASDQRLDGWKAGEELRAAVLYDGKQGESWRDAWSHLDQALLANLTVEAVEVSGGCQLSGYDVVYPDPGLIRSGRARELKRTLTDYVRAGGSLFLDNAFHSFFDPDFIGAAEFVKLDHCPHPANVTEAGSDLEELGGIIADFSALYPWYMDYGRLSGYDYGYAVRPSTARVLAAEGELGIYTMNRYGAGWVFFTNPLLPNAYSVNGFSLDSRSREQVSHASSTAGANQLIRNAFAGFVSKKKFGYAPYRVFGVLGRPSVAWALHLEDITGISRESAVPFIQMCRDRGQVPSFTLVRSTYYWLSRQESVSYALNEAEVGMSFSMDYEEDAYSSGIHIPTGQSGWVRLGSVEDAGSYFLDYPMFDQRCYPWVGDLDGDGKPDLLCGAADGLFHFYSGRGNGTRFAVGEEELLRDESTPLAIPGGGDPVDSPLSVPGYSAPVLWDVDGDGTADLISGAADGKLYWFRGLGGTRFRPQGVLLDTGLGGQVFPDAGDWDGDGCADLVVGSNAGALRVYLGVSRQRLQLSPYRWEDLSAACEAIEGAWLAPRLTDLDGDGWTDLAVGTFHGYVAKLFRDGRGKTAFGGYLTTQERTYKGNDNLKFGNNCVPFFTDLNGDGRVDLLAGSLEYGMAYPIDSPYFPYREELQAQVSAIQAAGAYIGLHGYTNEGASKERELYELKAHLEALRSYGIDTGRMGVNQHTWHTSAEDHTQTFLAQWEAGLLWNSGFKAPRSDATPEVSAENVLALPFFLTVNGERTILLQNSSTLTYATQPWDEIAGRYGVPTCVYYHCDWIFKPETLREAEGKLDQVDRFWSRYQYNFVREDQMMAATAAAYNLDLACLRQGDRLTLTPGERDTGFPLYDKAYQDACGLRLSFAETVDTSKVTTDAGVWCWVDGDLYIGLDRPVTVDLMGGPAADAHLERVNLPAAIRRDGAVTRVEFHDGGMMQVVLSGPAQVRSRGWTERTVEGKTVLTKYGPAETLELVF